VPHARPALSPLSMLQEEIGQALTGVRLAGVLENIFGWGGGTQHEIVCICTAAFADEAAYEIPEQTILDDGDRTRVIWRMPEAASPPLSKGCG
jgi:hypothetical protein